MVEDLTKKFSLHENICCVMQETKIFHQGPPPYHQCYYIVSSLQKITRFNSIVEYLRKKFSLDANISCVMQETKIFQQGPPSTLVLLYCKFLIENHSVHFDGERFKQENLFKCKHFLCYVRIENISLRTPLNWKISGRNSLQMRTFLVLCIKRKYFTKDPPLKNSVTIL